MPIISLNSNSVIISGESILDSENLKKIQKKTSKDFFLNFYYLLLLSKPW